MSNRIDPTTPNTATNDTDPSEALEGAFSAVIARARRPYEVGAEAARATAQTKTANKLENKGEKAARKAAIKALRELATSAGLNITIEPQEEVTGSDPVYENYKPGHNGGNHPSDTIELTREEAEFRQELLGGVSTSLETYTLAIGMLNQTIQNDPISGMSFEAALEMAQRDLTPAVVRDLYKQTQEAKARPIEPIKNSPTPGFDIMFVADEDLTEKQEDDVADGVQAAIPAYQGEPYVYRALHNEPHKQQDVSPVRVVFAPRHLNLPSGKADAQKAMIAAHNANTENSTSLRSAGDLEAMTAILHTIRTNPDGIDWKTSGYDEERFWATYYRNVEATPGADGDVPNVYVGFGGRFYRLNSGASNVVPTRALVVPKKV